MSQQLMICVLQCHGLPLLVEERNDLSVRRPEPTNMPPSSVGDSDFDPFRPVPENNVYAKMLILLETDSAFYTARAVRSSSSWTRGTASGAC